MAVPKKKTSKSRTKSRRAANTKTPAVNLTVCKKCNAKVISHTVCKACGTYKDKQIIGRSDK